MKPLVASLLISATLGVLAWIQPKPAFSAIVLSGDKAAQIVAVRNLTVKDGTISGELFNNSPRLLRDVELLIRYTWHWKNEYRPGKDDLGMAVYYTVERKIPPGETVPFTYRPSSPLPSRPDGYFVTAVSVAGFTEVVQQSGRVGTVKRRGSNQTLSDAMAASKSYPVSLSPNGS
ncbi:MAG: hypothetical protein O7B35_03230 [Deltaproteobacteria bacterium]|nr:hypothetical protein [Deltaproteobacteria bacterium]